MHHRTIQINHQPDATNFQFIILTFVYSSTCFGRFPSIIRSSMTAVAASGFTFVSWWWLCCVRGRAGRPDHEHNTKWTITTCLLRDSKPNYQCLKITPCRWRPPVRMHSFNLPLRFPIACCTSQLGYHEFRLGVFVSIHPVSFAESCRPDS